MDNKQTKAVLMALLGPQGTMMNLHKTNFDKMEENADEIMKRCELTVKRVVTKGKK